MFFRIPDSHADEPDRVEELLGKHSPWPEKDLARISKLASETPDDQQRFAEFRRTVLDIDGLLQDCRWGVGNALLIIRAFPEISLPLSDAEDSFDRIGIPSKAHLLISSLIRGRDRVFFDDPLERQPGGKTVGRWMVRILCDHSVNASIAVLDRLAQLLVLGGGIRAPRDRMYFRSGKLKAIRDNSGIMISDRLLGISTSDEFQLLLNYRDGYAHTHRLNTPALGAAAIDHYVDAAGVPQTLKSEDWSAEELLGIAVLAFHIACEGLEEVTEHLQGLLSP